MTGVQTCALPICNVDNRASPLLCSSLVEIERTRIDFSENFGVRSSGTLVSLAANAASRPNHSKCLGQPPLVRRWPLDVVNDNIVDWNLGGFESESERLEVPDVLWVDVAGMVKSQPATSLQQLSGQDAHSLEADAYFLDPEQGQFTVHAGSPALKLGFKNLSMHEYGVRSPRLRALARRPDIPRLLQAKPASMENAVPV